MHDTSARLVERVLGGGPPHNTTLGLKTMSLLDKLRKDATRESDPEIRRQRLAKIDEIESGVQDFDKRLAAVKAKLAESGSAGRKSFFSRIEFIYGLGAVAALVISFYFQLSPAAWIIVLCAVIFAMVGVHLLIIRFGSRNLTDRPNMAVLPDAAAGAALNPWPGSPRRKPPR